MGDANIEGSKWRLVEVGRVVVINDNSANQGKIATIVEIIDHKRALVEGPSTDAALALPRQPVSLNHCLLSHLVVEGLPRATRSPTVKKFWEASGIEEKWRQSNWAKRRQQQERRKALTDFDRFKVMRLKKQARFEQRKSLHKVRAAAA